MGDAGMQPFQHLNTFNSSVINLVELINANLSDPDQDVSELVKLQGHVNSMYDMVTKMIKTKSERIVEEVIPNYFANLAATEISTSISPNKRRKLVTFETQSENVEPADGPSSAITSPVEVACGSPPAAIVQESEPVVVLGNGIYIVESISDLPNTAAAAVQSTADSEESEDEDLSSSRLLESAADIMYRGFGGTAELTTNLPRPARTGVWLEYEELYLKELVSKHKSGPKGKRVVDWSAVSTSLNRDELDCRVKWTSLSNAKVRKGPYRVEEDQLIVNQVREACAAGGQSEPPAELWERLEATMDRPAKNIRLRWKITLSKRPAGPA